MDCSQLAFKLTLFFQTVIFFTFYGCSFYNVTRFVFSAVKRATKGFSAQQCAGARTYSYTMPTFAFADPMETNANYRITKGMLISLSTCDADFTKWEMVRFSPHLPRIFISLKYDSSLAVIVMIEMHYAAKMLCPSISIKHLPWL